MRSITGLCTLSTLLLLCFSPVYGQTLEEQAILETFQYEKDIVYKTVDGKDLSLVFFKPDNLKPGEKAPWMLYVHGGGWRGGNPYKIFRKPFLGTLKELTASGIACVAVNYRLTRGESTAYDCVVDCKDAAKFLIKNARELNLDPDRYGVWGGSAGGHLSLMTALGKDDDFSGDPGLGNIPLQFACVASYYPLTTLVNPDVLKGSLFEDTSKLDHLLDGSFTKKPDLARLLSPTEYLSEKSPPILLLHGEEDQTLSVNNSLYMMDVAKKAGADVELLAIKNAGHSFSGEHIAPSMEKINEKAARFIISHLTSQNGHAVQSFAQENTYNSITPDNANLRYNGVLYSIVTEAEAELHRYSEDYLKHGMDGTVSLEKARTQPGISISFKSNSPVLKLKFAELENSDIRKRRFSVFKDGILAYDHISDLEFILANPAKDTAEWEVYLPYFSGVKFLGLELSREYELYKLPVEDKAQYIAIGNSITHGVGQSGTLDTYPFLVANSLGFRHINLATGGSRISTEILRNFSEISPQLITILWGYNDVNQENALEDVLPVYDSLVNELCSRFPQADIYCILQTYTTTVVGRKNENNRIDSLRSWTRSSVENLQLTYSNLYYIDGEDYVRSEDDLKDRVHLNVEGARKLAEGIVREYLENRKLY